MSTTTVRQNKDANSVLDYVFDWEAFVDADSDTIVSTEISGSSDLTFTGTVMTVSTVKIFVAGGTEGTTYPIVNRIFTAGGRTEDKVLELTITQSPSGSHTIVVETGNASETANSNVSLANADSYHANHLYTSAWTQATDSDKEKSLIWATRLLDEQIDWTGFKRERAQALQWPRNGVIDRAGYLIDSDMMPQTLKDATAEMARFLLASDRTAEDDTIGFKRIKAGSVEIEIDKSDREARKQVIPKHIFAMLHPIGRPLRGQMKLRRS